MSNLAAIKFFLTPHHPCSYLSHEDATTLFADPASKVDKSTYAQLSELGFRRSGNYLYRPHCQSCTACIPIRLPVLEFTPKRCHKRTWKKNSDIQVVTQPASYDSRHFKLYAKYINARHSDGDMFPPSEEQYQSFLISQWSQTWFNEFWLQDQLIAVAVTDQLTTGLSAVYSFYDPDMAARSLGNFAILWQIQHAQNLGLKYVYLGYWIKRCNKMSYKNEFRPLEMFVNDRWIRQD